MAIEVVFILQNYEEKTQNKTSVKILLKKTLMSLHILKDFSYLCKQKPIFVNIKHL